METLEQQVERLVREREAALARVRILEDHADEDYQQELAADSSEGE